MVQNPNCDVASSLKLPLEMADAYRQIGHTLLVAEASTFSIGIPWVPQTQRTMKLRQEFSAPLQEFVRVNLVNVSSTTLESYAEDMEALAPNQESQRYLGIDGPSFVERYLLSLVLFCASFVVLLATSTWVKAAPSLVLGISLLVALIVAGISLFVCSEVSRRSTFHWLVYEELLRRRGTSQGDAMVNPLYAFIPERGPEGA